MTSKDLKIYVIRETPSWLSVSKPAGLIVERNPFESPTVEELVYDHLNSRKKNPYLGIVHRLDRVTSGIIVFAKKKSCLRHLNEQLALRQVHKTYLAITEKTPPEEKGLLKHYHLKNQKQKRAEVFDEPVPDSKEIILRYKVKKVIGEKALLEIQPQTGKFHQIRAQLAAIGCPILGDAKYGAESSYAPLSAALHAWKIQFVDPQTNNQILSEAPAPAHRCWQVFLSSQ